MSPIRIVHAAWDRIIDRIAPLGWQDEHGFHRGVPGPTHDAPSRDSRRQVDRNSNHNGGIARQSGAVN